MSCTDAVPMDRTLIYNKMRFVILKAVTMRIAVFRIVTLCDWIDFYAVTSTRPTMFTK
jgi:hypothetical protein